MTLLDHDGLDLDAAHSVTYLIEQTFRYDYDDPVESLRHRLMVIPPARHGALHRRSARVRVSGAAVALARRRRRDAAGNTVVTVRAARVEGSVEFRLAAVLERVGADGPTVLPVAALHDPRLLRPTRLTAPDARLTALARELAAGTARDLPGAMAFDQAGGTARDLPGAMASDQVGGAAALDLAQVLCSAVRSALPYEYGVTTIDTTAAEALAAGRGVCQDAAHIMLALCHVLRLPARYVSGHLLGQGGTHAWVEVVVPDADHGAVAVPFDPCNGRRAGAGYLTVAVGRDYTDVAPTSGTFVGHSPGRLTASRRVGVTALAA